MRSLADRIDDQQTGVHTTTELPVLTDSSPAPTTPQGNRKRSANSAEPGLGNLQQPSPSHQKRCRITLSDSYWDQKMKSANERHERIEPDTPAWHKFAQVTKSRGRDAWVRARLNAMSVPDKQKQREHIRADLKTTWSQLPPDFKAAWCKFAEVKQHDSPAPEPVLNPQGLDESKQSLQRLQQIVRNADTDNPDKHWRV